MDSWLQAVTSYPTAVLSTGMVVLMLYWALALMGWVDFESSGVDLELEMETEPGDLSTLAGYVVALGLNGVPFSIAVSLVIFTAWMISIFAAQWLLPLVPTEVLTWLVGTVVLLGSLALSLPIVARLIRPMRPLFVVHNATRNVGLVGKTCRIVSERADHTFGRAEVQMPGATPLVKVRLPEGQTLDKGATAIVIEYDEAAGTYLIQAPEGS